MTDAEDGLELASMERLRDPACPPPASTHQLPSPLPNKTSGESSPGPLGDKLLLGKGGHLPGSWWPSGDLPPC